MAHKEYFAYLSKFGKGLDNMFSKDINNVIDDQEFNP